MAGRFDNTLITRVQQASDIVDIISEHLSLDRKGKEYVGICPFHQDHRPSMYVNPEKQIFKCFACGAGGDAFKFLQMKENLSFSQAVERLAARAGISVAASFTESHRRRDDKTEKLLKLNSWVLKYWNSQLFDRALGLTAREYLKKRAFTKEAVLEWKLGFAADSWQDLSEKAMKAGFSRDLLVSAGLCVSRDDGSIYDKFRNRLMFPIMDISGRVIGFGGRTLGDDPAKYMNSPATMLFDKSHCLYGINYARHAISSSGTAVVVEGYTDVMMAHQHGCKNVVATLGTSFTRGHAHILKRYAKQVVLLFDGDVAGHAAADRALEVCLTEKIDIKVVFMPDGMDPCDFVLQQGSERFDELIAEANDVIDYKWSTFAETFKASSSLRDRKAAIDEFLKTIANALQGERLDAVTYGLITLKLSQLIGLSQQEITQQIKRYSRVGANKETVVAENRSVKSYTVNNLMLKTQREILEVLIAQPQLYKSIEQTLLRDDFTDPILKEIAEAVFTCIENDVEFSQQSILRYIETPEASNVLTTLYESSSLKEAHEKRLKDALDVLWLQRQNHKLMEVKQQAGNNQDDKLKQINEMLLKNNKRNPGMLRL